MSDVCQGTHNTAEHRPRFGDKSIIRFRNFGSDVYVDYFHLQVFQSCFVLCQSDQKYLAIGYSHRVLIVELPLLGRTGE